MSFEATKRWEFAGPVAQAYELARGPMEQIVGPTGGGKTTGSARRGLRVATWQHPSPKDGIRKARTLVVTPTYRGAWDKVIPSYVKVMGGFGGKFSGAKGDPYDHIFDAEVKINGVSSQIHVEVLFRSPGGEQDYDDFFRGFEFTQMNTPETDTHEDENILSKGSNRVGRYPEPDDRPTLMPTDPHVYANWKGKQPPGWEKVASLLERRDALIAAQVGSPDDTSLPDRIRLTQELIDEAMPRGWTEASVAYKGVSGDANAPIIDSWFHRRFFIEKRPGDRLHLQPSGFSARAENMQNLRKISPRYYAEQAAQLDAHDIRRLLENRPGYGRHGQPVHPDFDQDVHVVQHSLDPDPQLPVIIGVDCGSNSLIPGATFGQRGYSGQHRRMAEIFLPEPDKEARRLGVTGQMTIEELGAEIRRIMATRFRLCRKAVIIVDPAAAGGNAVTGFSTAHHLQHHSGIEVITASSNRPPDRRGALSKVLKRTVGPKEPAYVISGPDCPGLVAGLGGGWHYPKRGSTVSSSTDKGRYSHVCEADEYAILGSEGVDGVAEGLIRHDGEGAYDAPRIIDE